MIHNYRWLLGLAEGEPHYDELEQRLATAPVITVHTMTLEGDARRTVMETQTHEMIPKLKKEAKHTC